MAKRRGVLIGVLAVGALLVGALLWMLGEDSARQNRSGTGRGASARAASGAAGTDAASETGDDSARRARLAELVERFGGVRPRGRLLLTRPEAPGSGFELRLETVVDGEPLRALATTDATGAFAFPTLPRLDGWALVLEHERLKPLRVEPGEAPAPADGEVSDWDLGEIRADRWYFLVGRVRAEASRAVDGAQVALVEPQGGNDFSFRGATAAAASPDPVLAAGISAADGSFRLRLADPGIFTLRVQADGWATRYRPDVVLGGAADAVADVALTRGMAISGIVLDGVGRPVAEATVALSAMMAARRWSMPKELATTDGSGTFAFRVEPMAGRYIVNVVPPRGIGLSKMVDLPLTEELVLRLPGTGVLVGRVVDRETDQPIAGAEVLIALNEGQGGMRMGMPDFSKVLLTDAVGGFRVEGIGPSSLSSIAVRAEGYEQLVLNGMFPTDRALWTRVEKTAIDPTGETALPALALGRGRELSGTIADRAGATPIEGAVVELWDFVMGSRATTTDATGRYHFTGVGDRVALVVSAPGYAPFRDPPFPGFSLPEGQEDARRDVELEPAGVVEGRVRGARGEPVPHALVRLQAEMRGPAGWLNTLSTGDLYAWTGDDGNYRIEGVPPIELRAEAQAPGYDRASSEAKTLTAGARLSGLDLTLLAAARLEGRVLDRGGRPVAGARVTVSRRATADDPGVRWRALAEGVSAFTGDDGRFAVAEVPVGDLDLRVEAEGFAIRTIARAGIEPGADIRNVAIELEPAFTIRGAVRDAQGRPVTWCWVRATRSGAPEGDAGNGLLGARVEPDGTFELRGLPEGLYRIDVVVGNWMPEATRYQNAQIENVAAGTEDLRVVLVAAAEGGAGGG